MKVVLASRSPRRKAILEHHGYEVVVDVSDIDERKTKNEDVKQLVMDLARQKAEAVLARHHNSLIIAADTMVYMEGEQINQQNTPQEAEKTLRKMLGRTHEVYSGVCVINPKTKSILLDYEVSEVSLRNVSEDTLKAYISSGQYLGKAGAYNISDPEFESFVESVQGSRSNIIGLPIEKVNDMIQEVQKKR